MVDLFFVMSGFIMMHVHGSDFRTLLTKQALRNFFVARFARTYPLHLFSTVLLILLVLAFSPPGTYPNAMEFPSAIPTNIFLLQSFYIHRIYTWNIPAWSISAEWAAYCIFPIFALFTATRKGLSIVILSIFIAFSYFSIMYILPRRNPMFPAVPVPHNINTTYDYGFLRGIAGFTLGMLMYLAYQMPACKRVFQKDGPAMVCMLLLLISMHYALNDALCVVLFAALVICFASNIGRVHSACNNRVLQYLGNISYSIYLMQIFLQDPFSKGLRLPSVSGIGRGRQNIAFGSGLLYCIAYLALLVAIATITYYAIEKPCRKFINSRWRQQS